MVLAILECAKGFSKGEITTAFVSTFLDLADTPLILNPVLWTLAGYEPNNIKGGEIVPQSC